MGKWGSFDGQSLSVKFRIEGDPSRMQTVCITKYELVMLNIYCNVHHVKTPIRLVVLLSICPHLNANFFKTWSKCRAFCYCSTYL